MKILYKNINDIRENDFNPNVIPEAKFKTLVRNIKDEGIGYVVPILIDSKNICIDGAHRLRACKEAGLKKIQCVIFEGDEKKKKLLTLAMNNIHGENDQEKLEALIADLSKGFDVKEIEEITGMNEVSDVATGKKGDDLSSLIKNEYEVVIECRSEKDQKRTYNQLKDKYKCRLLTL
jgi:ParB-like chromosome segregation protein Spo0J